MILPEAFSSIAMSDSGQLIDLWSDLGMPEPRQVPARVSEDNQEIQETPGKKRAVLPKAL
ncbi:hypothetical protein VCV18_003458 [Metarhizium anisopliae]